MYYLLQSAAVAQMQNLNLMLISACHILEQLQCLDVVFVSLKSRSGNIDICMSNTLDDIILRHYF